MKDGIHWSNHLLLMFSSFLIIVINVQHQKNKCSFKRVDKSIYLLKSYRPLELTDSQFSLSTVYLSSTFPCPSKLPLFIWLYFCLIYFWNIPHNANYAGILLIKEGSNQLVLLLVFSNSSLSVHRLLLPICKPLR